MIIPCLNSCRSELVVLDRCSSWIVGCTQDQDPGDALGALAMTRRTLIARPLDFRYSVHASLLSYHSTTNRHHFCAHLGDMHTSPFPAFQGRSHYDLCKKILHWSTGLNTFVSLLQFFVMIWIVNSLTAWWQLTTTMLILFFNLSSTSTFFGTYHFTFL